MSHALRAAATLALVMSSAACITGHVVLSTVCMGSASSCSCTVISDQGNAVACPAPGTKTLCCAEAALSTTYPADGATCTCTTIEPATAKCGSSDFDYCTCAADANVPAQWASCTAPTAWTACCADTLTGTCWCSISPDAGCGTGEQVVSSCSAQAGAEGSACVVDSGRCDCGAGMDTFTGHQPSCPATPPSSCCLDPEAGTCTCDWGSSSACISPAMTVPGCSAADVVPYLPAAACGQLEVEVASCSLP